MIAETRISALLHDTLLLQEVTRDRIPERRIDLPALLRLPVEVSGVAQIAYQVVNEAVIMIDFRGSEMLVTIGHLMVLRRHADSPLPAVDSRVSLDANVSLQKRLGHGWITPFLRRAIRVYSQFTVRRCATAL